MPKKRARKQAKKQVPPSARHRRGGYVCPTCGFKAAHAMGLGRHRTARHGATSARAKAAKKSGRVNDRSVADLERRFDALLDGMEKPIRAARKRRS